MKCEDKIKYPTEEHASMGLRKAHRRGLINIRYYCCEVCGNYHLTKQVKVKEKINTKIYDKIRS